MFSPGPSTMFTPINAASAPRYAPSSSPSSSSQLLAMAAAVGKHVEGQEVPMPRWLGILSCTLSPCGPSESVADCMPISAHSADCQNAEPVKRRHLVDKSSCSILFLGIFLLKRRGKAVLRSARLIDYDIISPFCVVCNTLHHKNGAPARFCAAAVHMKIFWRKNFKNP